MIAQPKEPQGRAANATSTQRRVLIWDLSVRTFHWLLVVLVAAAWTTGGSGAHWHELAGGGIAGLLLFRLLWGTVGSRHARFVDFIKGPRATLAYLKALLGRHPPHYLGHNPAGAMMIVALIGALSVLCATGFMMKTIMFFGVPWVETVHGLAAKALLLLIVLHVLGAIVSCRLHNENLVRAMVTGRKLLTLDVASQVRGRLRVSEMEHRIRGAHGLTILLVLLSFGLAYGWTVGSRKSEIAAEAPPAVQAGAVVPDQPRSAPEQDAARIQRPASAPTRAPAATQAPQRIAVSTGPTDTTMPRESRPNPPRNAAAPVDGRYVRIRGTLTAPYAIDGVSFRIDSATRVDDRPHVGDWIELRGILESDGTFRATRLRRR